MSDTKRLTDTLAALEGCKPHLEKVLAILSELQVEPGNAVPIEEMQTLASAADAVRVTRLSVLASRKSPHAAIGELDELPADADDTEVADARRKIEAAEVAVQNDERRHNIALREQEKAGRLAVEAAIRQRDLEKGTLSAIFRECCPHDISLGPVRANTIRNILDSLAFHSQRLSSAAFHLNHDNGRAREIIGRAVSEATEPGLSFDSQPARQPAGV